jgi:hypothetical protein
MDSSAGDGRARPGGACAFPAESMNNLGMAISLCAVLFEGVLILRGAGSRLFRLFPLFYTYIIYSFCGTLIMYVIHWRFPLVYPSAYWPWYLVSILAEFAILVEISDHIFRPFPAIRNLGRALTILVSVVLGLAYVLPTIVGHTGRSRAISSFLLRTFATKAIILVVLFYFAHLYEIQLAKNVGGLMLGFSIYVAINVTMMGSIQAFGSALFARVIWFTEPLAFALCELVWIISLWELAPMRSVPVISAEGSDSGAVSVGLTRFNSELSKILYK